MPPRRVARSLFYSILTVAVAYQAPGQSWKFLVLGDSRGPDAQHQINTTILAELAAATTRERPVFVLVPGDLINSGSLAGFQEWTNIMSPVYQAGIGVYPVLGNHDVTDVASFIRVFGPYLPNNGPAGEVDRTYAITHANALVLMLDSYVAGNTLRVNQDWINSVLATNTRPHVFAMSHVPAFKVRHADCLDDYPSNRNTLWTSLRNARCRTYFSGHDHFYDHLRVGDRDDTPNNDIHQLIVGTGGAPITEDGVMDGANSSWVPAREIHDAQYGYVAVQIDGENVQATWYRRTSPRNYAAAEVFSYSLNLSTRPSPPVVRSITVAGGK